MTAPDSSFLLMHKLEGSGGSVRNWVLVIHVQDLADFLRPDPSLVLVIVDIWGVDKYMGTLSFCFFLYFLNNIKKQNHEFIFL